MNILITGGAGYIGSHCVKYLQKDHNIIIYDSLSNGHKEAVTCSLIQGNLEDKEKLNKVFKNNKIDIVIHFAGFIEVSESTKDPSKYYNNNVLGTLSLLDTMIKNNVKNIIFSSTAAVFGEPQETPIKETHPKKPINPYGQTKCIIEKILEDYDKAYSLKYIILRYFNAAGANEEIGESHNPETHLIPLILQAALGKKDSIKLFGTDYNTKDGTCIRDFIHIKDLINAHILAMNYLIKEQKSNNFNLGSNQGYSVKEIINLAKEITKTNFKVIEEPRRAGDPAILIADSTKAKTILGWQPTHTIQEIINSAWQWHQNQRY